MPMNPELSEYLALASRIPGVRVIENPEYGGVSLALHSATGEHPKGNAADINYGPPGAPEIERTVLIPLAEAAHLWGLNRIYTPWRRHPNSKTAANHLDHLHVDGGRQQTYPVAKVDKAKARAIIASLMPATPVAPEPPAPAQSEEDITTMGNYPFMFRAHKDDAWTIALSPTKRVDAPKLQGDEGQSLRDLFGEPEIVGAEMAARLRGAIA